MPKLCVNQRDTTYLEELIATVPHGCDHGFSCGGIGGTCSIPREGLRGWKIVRDVMGSDEGEKWLFSAMILIADKMEIRDRCG